MRQQRSTCSRFLLIPYLNIRNNEIWIFIHCNLSVNFIPQQVKVGLAQITLVLIHVSNTCRSERRVFNLTWGQIFIPPPPPYKGISEQQQCQHSASLLDESWLLMTNTWPTSVQGWASVLDAGPALYINWSFSRSCDLSHVRQSRGWHLSVVANVFVTKAHQRNIHLSSWFC